MLLFTTEDVMLESGVQFVACLTQGVVESCGNGQNTLASSSIHH